MWGTVASFYATPASVSLLTVARTNTILRSHLPYPIPDALIILQAPGPEMSMSARGAPHVRLEGISALRRRPCQFGSILDTP